MVVKSNLLYTVRIKSQRNLRVKEQIPRLVSFWGPGLGKRHNGIIQEYKIA
jgi:hypothetical protein